MKYKVISLILLLVTFVEFAIIVVKDSQLKTDDLYINGLKSDKAVCEQEYEEFTKAYDDLENLYRKCENNVEN